MQMGAAYISIVESDAGLGMMSFRKWRSGFRVWSIARVGDLNELLRLVLSIL
jgi:hypothetical protein